MLFLIVLLPWLALPLFVATRYAPRLFAPWLAAVGAAASLVLLGTLVPAVLVGEIIVQSVPWVPSLGLDLSLRLDGLGLLFALPVLIIGLLVILYAAYYLSEGADLVDAWISNVARIATTVIAAIGLGSPGRLRCITALHPSWGFKRDPWLVFREDRSRYRPCFVDT